METALTFVRKKTSFEKVISSRLFWLFFTMLAFTYPIIRSFTRTLPEPKPILFQVPEFSFKNEFGKSFGSKDLKGKTYLASFAFTSCPTTCPALMENLQKVQKRVRGLGQKVAIVTFSVDPANDTSKVLYKHSRKYKANPYIWSFLTGETAPMRELLVKGFKVPMGNKEEFVGKVENEDVTMMDIAHTNKLVLVDNKGGIRGYYSTDRDGINQLMIDLGLLVNSNLNS